MTIQTQAAALTDAQGVQLMDSLRLDRRTLNIGSVDSPASLTAMFKATDPAVVNVIRSAANSAWDGKRAKARDIIKIVEGSIPRDKANRWRGWTAL